MGGRTHLPQVQVLVVLAQRLISDLDPKTKPPPIAVPTKRPPRCSCKTRTARGELNSIMVKRAGVTRLAYAFLTKLQAFP